MDEGNGLKFREEEKSIHKKRRKRNKINTHKKKRKVAHKPCKEKLYTAFLTVWKNDEMENDEMKNNDSET